MFRVSGVIESNVREIPDGVRLGALTSSDEAFEVCRVSLGLRFTLSSSKSLVTDSKLKILGVTEPGVRVEGRRETAGGDSSIDRLRLVMIGDWPEGACCCCCQPEMALKSSSYRCSARCWASLISAWAFARVLIVDSIFSSFPIVARSTEFTPGAAGTSRYPIERAADVEWKLTLLVLLLRTLWSELKCDDVDLEINDEFLEGENGGTA